MARKPKEDKPPKGAPAWTATFGDLMNLLLCFFVMLFAMSKVDEEKFTALSQSLAISFSVFNAGSQAYGDGTLISNGASQLNQLDEYFQSLGETDTEKNDDEIFEDNQQGGDLPEQGKENPDDKTQSGDNVGGDTSGTGDTPPDSGTDTPGTGDTTQESGDNKQESGDKSQDSGNDGQTTGDKSDSWQQELLEENKQQTTTLYSEVSDLVDAYQLSDYLELSVDTERYQYIMLEVKGAVLFDSGKDSLKDSALPIISRIGDILNIYKEFSVEVIGHTDSVPINTTKFPNNNYLSCARAISVAEYLISQKDIDSERIAFSGRGEYEPIATNATEEGREKNRRVEFRLYNAINSNLN